MSTSLAEAPATTTYPDVPTAVDTLAREHPDVDDLAGYLAGLKVHGIPGDTVLCVVAAFIRKTVPDAEVQVHPDIVDTGGYLEFDDGCVHDLPPVVNELARKFDAGVYPSLYVEGYRTPETREEFDTSS